MPPTTPPVAFFSSAASSFRPTPYASTALCTSSRNSSHSARTLQRSHDSLAIPPLGMDPLPTDPQVHFIHPPFNKFPDSHLHPDGLTYQLMADNPEWFLDAKDFLSPVDGGKGPLVYPPHLEPPRGWCPAKKRDLKERGAEGWPEGEEPRLRCTFCRRTYAGVNAKSMWRRHVFEKHRIAMSNRRDGNLERPRGRGSGKENRVQTVPKPKDAAHDSLLSIIVAPQTASENISHKSRFRPAKLQEPSKPRPEREREQPRISSVDNPPQEQLNDEDSECDDDPLKSPPLTPHGQVPPDPTYDLGGELNTDIELLNSVQESLIPESPYNPLQTPSFRHSPPRLPSPWRFPSPSHPLHSTTRDLSLTIVAQPGPSPAPIGISNLGSSPSMLLPLTSSPFPKDRSIQSSDAFETPARSTYQFAKPTNRPYLFLGQGSSPMNSVVRYRNRSHTIGGSPLRKTIPFTTVSQHKRHSSANSEVWFSDGNLTSLSSTPLRLPHTSTDPFSTFGSWPPPVEDGSISPVRFSKVFLEPESPVLRNGSQPILTGQGIGLLEPFSSPTKSPDNGALNSSPLPGWSSSARKRMASEDGSDDLIVEVNSSFKKRRKSPTDT